MLNIDTEFRKGILFVRLTGELNKETIDKLNEEVTMLILDNGIKNIVFNIEGLTVIDIKGINALLYNYEIISKNKGKSCVCGINNNVVKQRINNSRLLKYMYEASDELSAFNVINL